MTRVMTLIYEIVIAHPNGQVCCCGTVFHKHFLFLFIVRDFTLILNRVTKDVKLRILAATHSIP